jgi:hypothetical protein
MVVLGRHFHLGCRLVLTNGTATEATKEETIDSEKEQHDERALDKESDGIFIIAAAAWVINVGHGGSRQHNDAMFEIVKKKRWTRNATLKLETSILARRFKNICNTFLPNPEN